MKDIIIKKGKNPGKTSVILAGVHGNEKGGVRAFQKILPELNIENGIVYFIYANPKAIDRDVRYIDVNLNRLFREENTLSKNEKESYEYGRMLFEKEISEASSIKFCKFLFTVGSPPVNITLSMLQTFIIVEDTSLNFYQLL